MSIRTIPSLLALLGALLAGAQGTETHVVHFKPGSSTLDMSALAVLDAVAASLARAEALRLELSGHTDSDGDVSFNQALSEARVQAVTKALQQRGVSATLLRPAGHGELRPVADNADPTGRRANRRVEVLLVREGNAVGAGVSQQAAESSLVPVMEVGDTVIVGPGGTVLRMPKDVFCEDISRVRFQIEEMPGIGEMMLNDLPTQTGDGQCLQSGGVLRLRATLDGREVQPCAGKQIEVTIPTQAVDPAMVVYELAGPPNEQRWARSAIPLAASGSDGPGYNFRTPFLGAVNIDKPAVVPSLTGLLAKIAKRDRGLVVRSRRMDYDRSYLASRLDNMVVKGDEFKKRKMRFESCALRMDGQFAGVFTQEGRTYFVGKPLAELKFKRLGNRYVLRKRDYIAVSDTELKAKLLAMTTDERLGMGIR